MLRLMQALVGHLALDLGWATCKMHSRRGLKVNLYILELVSRPFEREETDRIQGIWDRSLCL